MGMPMVLFPTWQLALICRTRFQWEAGRVTSTLLHYYIYIGLSISQNFLCITFGASSFQSWRFKPSSRDQRLINLLCHLLIHLSLSHLSSNPSLSLLTTLIYSKCDTSTKQVLKYWSPHISISPGRFYLYMRPLEMVFSEQKKTSSKDEFKLPSFAMRPTRCSENVVS